MCAARRAVRRERVRHCAHRPRRAERGVPLAAPEARHHRLDLELRRGARALHALLGDRAVAEVLRAQAHAAHVQALEPLGGEPLADDQLGAAAADVDHQPVAGLARRGVRDAEVDQARLFDAGDDLDRVAERIARPVEERALAPRLAQRVGAHHAHPAGLHVVQPLPEALEALQRAGDGFTVEAALLVEAGREPHRLAQAVDDHQLAVRVTRDHHVEAVGPEVDRREDVGQRIGRLGHPLRPRRRSRSRRSWWRSGCGSRTAHPRGLPCSRSRRRRGTGSSSGPPAA